MSDSLVFKNYKFEFHVDIEHYVYYLLFWIFFNELGLILVDIV